MSARDTVQVYVSGPWACFTRPELKVERVSYPVMTPSAARGILEAILWKPQFRWIIERILVLKEIRFQAFRRNEVQSKIAPKTVARWMKDPTTFEPCWADFMGDDDARSVRTQRNTLALREVAYVIEARVMLTPLANRPRQKPLDVDEPPGPDTEIKYVEMFNRRVEKGQCWQRPYLGCREFAADFRPVRADDRPISDTRDLGLMLYDIVYDRQKGHRAVCFAARLERGALCCDPETALPDETERKEVPACSSNV